MRACGMITGHQPPSPRQPPSTAPEIRHLQVAESRASVFKCILLGVLLLSCLRCLAALPLMGHSKPRRLLQSFSATVTLAQPLDYLAICAVGKNQAIDLPFWAEWHRSVGVSRIYLWDHGSHVPMSPAVQDLIDDGYLQYTWFSDSEPAHDEPAQFFVYNRCIEKYASRHRFLAFLDIDEFLVLRDRQRFPMLPDLLRNYESFGGLAVNWLVFGSSGHKQRPASPNVFEAYDMCMPTDGSNNDTLHVKVIANAAQVLGHNGNPHQFRFRDGSTAVTENMEPLDSHQTTRHHSKYLSLHHYVLKSEEEFATKITRGVPDRGTRKSWPWFHAIDALCTVNCTARWGRPSMDRPAAPPADLYMT